MNGYQSYNKIKMPNRELRRGMGDETPSGEVKIFYAVNENLKLLTS
jgi:hypothetical protein